MTVYIDTVMDGIRLEAVSKNCVVCTRALRLYDRVLGAYRAVDLLEATPEVEVGLFVGNCRPLFRHVDCADPSLKSWKMKPVLHNCIRCRTPVSRNDIVQPVFGIESAKSVNPYDPTDVGLTLGERIYFVHVDCQNKTLAQGQGLLVTA